MSEWKIWQKFDTLQIGYFYMILKERAPVFYYFSMEVQAFCISIWLFWVIAE